MIYLASSLILVESNELSSKASDSHIIAALHPRNGHIRDENNQAIIDRGLKNRLFLEGIAGAILPIIKEGIITYGPQIISHLASGVLAQILYGGQGGHGHGGGYGGDGHGGGHGGHGHGGGYGADGLGGGHGGYGHGGGHGK